MYKCGDLDYPPDFFAEVLLLLHVPSARATIFREVAFGTVRRAALADFVPNELRSTFSLISLLVMQSLSS